MATTPASSVLDGIGERQEAGIHVLHPTRVSPQRRILFINSYGGSEVWAKVKAGQLPPHHMWGCIELVRKGYEVALAEPLKHFEGRRPFPHDWPIYRFARRWLRPDDIIYCGHTLLYWVPMLRALGALKCHLVSMTYAREELDFGRLHQGILALTPAASDQAKKIAPRVPVAHVSWGCDLNYFPKLPFEPRWFISCGITHRDFTTLSSGTSQVSYPVRLICPGIPSGISWSENVTIIDGGRGWNHQKANVSYQDLFHKHYAGALASLIILKHDPIQYTAVGFTNLLEALALGRATIVTRTGAIPTEIDVETAGCGLHVNSNDPGSLAEALRFLVNEPHRAAEMGRRGRLLAESHYNIERYARDIDHFFRSL